MRSSRVSHYTIRPSIAGGLIFIYVVITTYFLLFVSYNQPHETKKTDRRMKNGTEYVLLFNVRKLPDVQAAPECVCGKTPQVVLAI